MGHYRDGCVPDIERRAHAVGFTWENCPQNLSFGRPRQRRNVRVEGEFTRTPASLRAIHSHGMLLSEDRAGCMSGVG